MTKKYEDLLIQSALTVCGVFGASYLGHMVSGKPLDLPFTVFMIVSCLVGLLAVYCNEKPE